MATTTNYGWTTPDDTALVKDGAAAIRTLGSSIDTSLNTALGTKKAGLVLLNTTSFSGVSSQSVNDVFSATYENYRIVITADSSLASTDAQFRLRVSGSDNTSANYVYDRGQATQSAAFFGVTSGTGAAATLWNWGAHSGLYSSVGTIDLFRPFASDNTGGFAHSYYVDALSNHAAVFSGFLSTVTTSYTGFTIFPGSGTFSGTVRTYGYNQ